MMHDAVVSIEKLAFGGAGFGKVDGKACFVPFTAPGDVARIRVISDKRSYLVGEVRDLLETSPLRVSPPCPVFGSCGGCSWQHVSYPAQLAAKEDIFAEHLWRAGRVERERILPFAAAPEPYGYRSRVQLKVRFVAGELHVGFYRSGSHFVIDIPGRCAIARAEINGMIGELCDVMAIFPEPDRIPQVDVTVGDDGCAIVVFHYIGNRSGETGDFLGRNREMLDSATGIFIQSGRKETLTRVVGAETLSYRVPEGFLSGNGEILLSFRRGGFSQVNYRQNLVLLDTVFNWAGLTGTERVLDLFCGNGNFSVPLAGYAAEVVGIEMYEPSIDDAVANCTCNGVENATFICSSASDGVNRLVERGEKFDVVLLDPPRTGAAEVVEHLHSLEPRVIVYVSCDPATLARDIGMLRKTGYEVVKSRPVEMFPQTYHIESVTLLAPTGAIASKGC